MMRAGSHIRLVLVVLAGTLALPLVVSVLALRGPASVSRAADGGPSVVATVVVGSDPSGVAVNPTTNRIYTANYSGNNVAVIDGGTNTVVATVPVGSAPMGVAVNLNTSRIYVTHLWSNDVSVIDGGTDTVVATVPVGSMPRDVAVNPTTNRIYTANTGSSNVSVIDGDANAVVATVPVGSGPEGVAVNPTTNRIYTANYSSNNVSVIDGDANTVVATIPVGSGPWPVAVNPTTNRIYTANAVSNNVSVIDGDANTVVATVPVGSCPDSVAVNPTTNRIYVANVNSDNVSVIDGGTNTVVATVPVGSAPSGVAVNPGTNRIYVANWGDDTVSVIEDTPPTDTPTPAPTDTFTPTPTPTPTPISEPQLALDLVQDTGWCNTIDATDTVDVGTTHQAAICLVRPVSGTAPADLDIVVNFNHLLNTCSNIGQIGFGLDANPDFVAQGTGWDCSLGGNLYPYCDINNNEVPPVTTSEAFILCNTGKNPGTVSGPEVIAVITWTATGTGTDNLTFGTASLYDFSGNKIVTCPSAGCHGATVTKALCHFGDADADCDGVLDTVDNCPTVYNPDQLNRDGGRRPNGSRIPNEWASNPAQDKLGDVCDPDDDNDGLPDAQEFDDQCPYRLVADSDGDGVIDRFEVAAGFDPCNAALKPGLEGGADSDGDGFLDGWERGGYNTCVFTGDAYPGYGSCAVPQDSDGDGCADTLEALDLNGDRRVNSLDIGLLNKRFAGKILADDPVSETVFDLNKDESVSSADTGLMNKRNCLTKPGQLGCPVCPAE